MKLCEFCFHINDPAATQCSHCGRELPEKQYVIRNDQTTDRQNDTGTLGAPAPVFKHTQHLGHVDRETIALYIEDTSNPLVLRVNDQVVLGRYTPNNVGKRPIDLDPYDAFEKGVSRLHAAIRRLEDDSYIIVDLGSTNGTMVNGEPLTPHEPFRLRNGDLIRLGALNLYFYGPT
ncbi:MAG: hypothetical protein Kow00120_10820 [Anaerolineae bacterium]